MKSHRCVLTVIVAAFTFATTGSTLAQAGPARAGERVAAAQTGIEAPETIEPGEALPVAVSNMSPEGRLELWGPVSGVVGQEEWGARVLSVPVDQNLEWLTAPALPGSYQLRYVGATGSVLARHAIEVVALPVMLFLDERVPAGRPVTVRWFGPADPGDRIQFADPETGEIVTDAVAEGKPGRENATEIEAPDRNGAFELRYWSGQRNAVLLSLTIVAAK